MTKTEIAKRLREISDNLLEARLDLRGRSEDKLLELLDASIEAEEAIKDLMLDANAGKMPRKTPVRNKSNQVFYIEKTLGILGNGLRTWTRPGTRSCLRASLQRLLAMLASQV